MVEEGEVTDGSSEVALLEAPSHWVRRLGPLEKEAVDDTWEPLGAWRIELAPSEFLIHPDPRALALARLSAATVDAGGSVALHGRPSALRLPCYSVEKGDAPLPERFMSPLLQRTRILVPMEGQTGESRALSTQAGRAEAGGAELAESGFIARFGPTPHAGSASVVDLKAVDLSGENRVGEAARSAWYRFFALDAPVAFSRKP